MPRKIKPSEYPAPDFDQESPLDRVKGETLRANRALRDYYNLGPGRSMKKLLQAYEQQRAEGGKIIPPVKSLVTLLDWSRMFGWQARVAAQVEIENQELQRLYSERRAQVVEADWAQAQALRDLAGRILAEGPQFIKTRRKVVKGSPKVVNDKGQVLDPGQPDQVVITMELDLGGAIKAATTASSLARLSVGMVTDNKGLQVENARQAGEVDYSNVDDSTLRRILQQSGSLFLALASGAEPKPDEGSSQESGDSGQD